MTLEGAGDGLAFLFVPQNDWVSVLQSASIITLHHLRCEHRQLIFGSTIILCSVALELSIIIQSFQ